MWQQDKRHIDKLLRDPYHIGSTFNAFYSQETQLQTQEQTEPSNSKYEDI